MLFLYAFAVATSLAVLPGAVLGCEGECISGSTDKFCSKYIGSDGVLNDLIKDSDCRLQRCYSNSPCSDVQYLAPIMFYIQDQCFDKVRQAVFPEKFHGKCQREDGTEPDGCPNPDCPVICGTPGSMVHFLESDLVPILFNTVDHLLDSTAHAGSAQYNQSLALFEQSGGQDSIDGEGLKDDSVPSASRIFPRDLLGGLGLVGNIAGGLQAQQADTCTSDTFDTVVGNLSESLATACGENLEHCTWKEELSKFILQYP